MSGNNAAPAGAHGLTREEAAERAGLIRVNSYQIELDLHGRAGGAQDERRAGGAQDQRRAGGAQDERRAGGAQDQRDTGGARDQYSQDSFRSLTTVRFDCARPGTGSFIDLSALEVSRIELNGTQLPLSSFDGSRVWLPDLAATNELTVDARCAYSRTGEGLHRFTDPADGGVYIYSNLETCYAQRVYVCFDQPDMKSTFEFTVRCPAGWQVISNTAADGPARAAADAGQPGQAGPDIETWHFPATPPMSTYITAIAAGPFHVVRDEHDGIPLGLFCRQSLASYLDPAELFEVTAQGLDYFHRAFDVRYPFGKYDQIFVPEFNAGAMENAGAVTFVEEHIFRSRVTDARHEARAETILHELAHMWFGNLVTMTWWDDLWLNESFATWASLVALAEATRWPGAWTTFSQDLKAWAYRQDQLPSTHPIVADIVDVEAVELYFDGITYAKGAAVLKQLVAFVGAENFLTGLRSYFASHAWGNATLADLMDVLEQASGRSLHGWSKAWLETAGVNTLRPVYAAADDGTFAEFAVTQQAAPSHPVLRPHRIAIGLYDRVFDGTIRRRRRIELDVTAERTEVPDLIGERRPDVVLVNDDDLTFAKIRLDDHSLRTVISSVGDFADPLPAALCLAAAWDMCRDAEMRARDYASLALSAAAKVTDINVLQTLLGRAAAAVRRFADPGWRATGLEQLAAGAKDLMLSAEPGSDRQLASARVFISVASSPPDLELLTGLLAGSEAVDGLVIDTDMRWQLVRRLVATGALGEEAIEAAHDLDKTDAGERQALGCRAAIPDPAAKEAAWTAIMSGELPNATFRAVLTGFQAADQDELLAPYASRFFDVVADKWREWGPDMAQFFATHGYPVMVITQPAVDAAATYLARDEVPEPLRRLLAEGRDDVARALRCRERDAQPE